VKDAISWIALIVLVVCVGCIQLTKFIYRGIDMNGYKTVAIAAVTALINLAVAFGVELTPAMTAAILGAVDGILLPIAMVWVRLKTTGPTPLAQHFE